MILIFAPCTRNFRTCYSTPKPRGSEVNSTIRKSFTNITHCSHRRPSKQKLNAFTRFNNRLVAELLAVFVVEESYGAEDEGLWEGEGF